MKEYPYLSTQLITARCPLGRFDLDNFHWVGELPSRTREKATGDSTWGYLFHPFGYPRSYPRSYHQAPPLSNISNTINTFDCHYNLEIQLLLRKFTKITRMDGSLSLVHYSIFASTVRIRSNQKKYPTVRPDELKLPFPLFIHKIST